MTLDIPTAPIQDPQETIRLLQQELRETSQEVLLLNLELEKRVDERTEELRRANKDLEAFTYSISHDLRAPLRAIAGAAGVLQEDFSAELSAEAKQFIGVIVHASEQMRQMIEGLLNFSRLGRQPLKVQPVNLSPLVHEVVEDLLQEPTARHATIDIQELPPCKGDPLLLRHVFMNLISNAVKFSRLKDKPIIQIGSCLQDGERVYFVRDNGVGFDMQYADKLFGVFQRMHKEEEFEGTGVGLSIVRRIIERHGGRIWAQAAVGDGATFYFTLS